MVLIPDSDGCLRPVYPLAKGLEGEEPRTLLRDMRKRGNSDRQAQLADAGRDGGFRLASATP